MNTTTLDDSSVSQIQLWYSGLNFLKKVGLWTLIAAGATAAVVALMHPHLQVAAGGALMAAGAKMLIPLLVSAAGQGT